MGLAGPKKRAKLSHDPNNTAWSRNTSSFGHRILASQGWNPGDTLGAKDALHADHYTAGSNSHIRVSLKDNQLGLGAKTGGNSAETFGLSLFSGILGRLNGKSDVEVEKEQRAQKDVELALYQSRKLGHINFVSAGYLVGDRIERAEIVTKDQLKKVGGEKPEESLVTVKAVPAKESSGTKRKRGGTEEKPKEEKESSADSESSSSEEETEPARKSKKSRKEKKDKSATTSAAEDETSKSTKRSSKPRKDKKSKPSSTSTSEDEDRAAKKASKAERRAQKEERRAQKEERRKKKEAKRAAKSASASASATPASTAPATPAEPVSGASTPQASTPFIGRHAVRSRYIAAKGRAHLDPQALKEIFMVKA